MFPLPGTRRLRQIHGYFPPLQVSSQKSGLDLITLFKPALTISFSIALSTNILYALLIVLFQQHPPRTEYSLEAAQELTYTELCEHLS